MNNFMTCRAVIRSENDIHFFSLLIVVVVTGDSDNKNGQTRIVFGLHKRQPNNK